MSTGNRRADGKIRPTVLRYRRRQRQRWLDNFKPGARGRFFRFSLARQGEGIFLRGFARSLGIPESDASLILEARASESKWMKLRTRDGMVVGIAPPKKPKVSA